MAQLRFIFAGLLFASLSHGFNLWPLVETEGLANALQITTDCTRALNQTVTCDQDLFQRTVNVDGLWWTREDTSALCSSGCISSAHSWQESVGEQCAGEFLIQRDKLVEAETLAGRFVEGLDLACLQSSSSQWCFVEQQEWTGSDIVTPDCAANPADPYCSSAGNVSAEHKRISSLYNDDLLCSECFLKLMYARLTSEFLPDVDHSDYLVEEFQDIQAVCQTSVGELTTRILPQYPSTTDAIGMHPIGTDVVTTGTGTATTTVPTATATADVKCDAGQWIDVLVTRETSEAETDLESCNELSEIYGIATGDLMVVTKNPGCSIEPTVEPDDSEFSEEGWFCGPQPCKLLRVNEGDTCESIAASLTNTSQTISSVQLATWNPNILGACDFLVKDQYICMTRRGGSWVGPPESEVPDDSEGPVRGGPGTTPSLPILENPSTPPTEVQEGIAAGCTRYVMANSTVASCWKISNDGGITQSRLYELNPVLGVNGENCGTQVWLGYYYCVGVGGDGSATTTTPPTTTPPTTTTPPSDQPKPTPTHDGTAANCNKWVQAESGASCWQLANDAGIELASLYAWNTALGVDGADCGTMIWPGYYYCIGVSSSSSPTTTTAAPPATTTAPAKPTQTQAGIPAGCNKFAEALAGASCWQLATDNGVELSLFYSWNPVLGSAGENCGSQIWPNYFYCVGVSG